MSINPLKLRRIVSLALNLWVKYLDERVQLIE